MRYLLIFFLSAAPLLAQAFPPQLQEARETYYRSDETSYPAALGELEALGESLGTQELAEMRLGAEVSYYRGAILLALGREKEGTLVLKEGMVLCKEGYKLYKDPFFLSMEGYLGSLWMVHQGLTTIIKEGPRMQTLGEQALEEDPQDLKAHILVAQGLINSPAIFGGDPAKAADLLEGAAPLAETKSQRFDLFLSIAKAYQRQKKWEEAQSWTQKALGLYPQNKDALYTQGRIENKKKN